MQDLKFTTRNNITVSFNFSDQLYFGPTTYLSMYKYSFNGTTGDKYYLNKDQAYQLYTFLKENYKFSD